MRGRRGALLALLALLASATSALEVPSRPEGLLGPLPPFPVPDGNAFRHRLANGIVVFVVEDASLPLVDVQLALPIGDYLDPPDRAGLAALTAALLRRGGTETLDPAAFDEAADALAADMDSLGGALRSGATLDCSSAVLPRALGLWSEMVTRPRFDAARLAHAMANLTASFAGRNDDPLELLGREWAYLLRGDDHPAARRPMLAHLERIERRDLVAFHRRHWRPEGAVVAVAGDVRTGEALALLERGLGSWGAEDGPAGPATPSLPPGRAAPPGLYHVEHPTSQVKVQLGHPTGVRRSWSDPVEPALELLGEVLGGGGTVSRLRSRLRAEAGLVYRASAQVGLGGRAPGEFQVFFEAEAGAVGHALQGVLEEIHRLRDEPVGDVELRLARKNLVDAFPLLFDSAVEIAGRFAEDALLGRPHDYWARYRARLEAVTAPEIQRAARSHLLPEEVRILVVGPWRDLSGALVGHAMAVTHLPSRDPLTGAPLAEDRRR